MKRVIQISLYDHVKDGATCGLADKARPRELHPGPQHPLHAPHTQPQEEGLPRQQSEQAHRDKNAILQNKYNRK